MPQDKGSFSAAARAPIFRKGIFLLLALCLSACGTGKPAPVANFGLTGGATSAGVHIVATGDTLWEIAETYRVDMKDIIYVNRLQAPYFIAAGDRLTLPPPLTYKVRPGDTLYDVSRTFAIGAAQLARQNGLKPPYRLVAGDSLRLPSLRPAYQDNPRIAIVRSAALPDGPPVAVRPVERVERSLPVPASTPPRSRGDGKFAWPVDGPILSPFGPKKDGLHNDGINIKAPKGAPVRAAENGTVVYADNQLAGFGHLVLIRHQDRWMTAYAHLDGAMVKAGETVRRGQTIGTVGRSGNVDTPQLHFELRRGTEAIDPQLYLVQAGS